MSRSARTHDGRRMALQALELWERNGLSAEEALATVCQGAPPRERGLAMELLFGAVRWLSRLDGLLTRLLKQPLGKLHPQVLNILRLGLFQLRSLSRMPVRAVIYESVELCRFSDLPWAAGLVNGVLRRYDREREALEALPAGKKLKALASRWAHPLWLAREMLELSGNELEAWLEANDQVPPLTLRVNRPRCSREELLSGFSDVGLEARPTIYSPDGVVVDSKGAVTSLPGFEAGAFVVQDEASQLVSLLLGAREGERVLDACAAPGGKTTHLAALVGPEGSVVATDRAERRLPILRDSLERLGLARVRVARCDWVEDRNIDNGKDVVTQDGRAGGLFDRALVDAPCSGLGIVRRIPEIKWRREAENLMRYQERQLAILRNVAGVVKPGGVMVYSVCSPLPLESIAVVESFLACNKEWSSRDLREVVEPGLEPLLNEKGVFASFPHRHNCDAFVALRLERNE